MNKCLLLFLLIALLNTTTGCVQRLAFGNCTYRINTAECYQELSQDSDLTKTSFTAADHLMQSALTELYPAQRILVTTIADIDNLTYSSSLGRLIGEQLAARFAQKGYTVTEAKLYDHLLMLAANGEFVLSRHPRQTSLAIHGEVIVAGTYAVGKNTVYVTLKMLDRETDRVIGAYAYVLPIGPNTYALLQKDSWNWW